MSGLLPKADIRQRIEHVCFVPEADLSQPGSTASSPPAAQTTPKR